MSERISFSSRENLTRVRKRVGFYREWDFIECEDDIPKSVYLDPVHHVIDESDLDTLVKCKDIARSLKGQGIKIDIDRMEGFISLEGFEALTINHPMVSLASRVPPFQFRDDVYCPKPAFHLCDFSGIVFIGLYIKGSEERAKFQVALSRYISRSGYEVMVTHGETNKQYHYSSLSPCMVPSNIILNFLKTCKVTNLSINSFGRKISIEDLLYMFGIDKSHSNPTQSLDRFFIPTPFHPMKKDFLYNNFDISYTISNPKPNLTYIKNYHTFLCSSKSLGKVKGLTRRDYNLLGERESGYTVINWKDDFKVQYNPNSPTYIKKLIVYQPKLCHLAKAYINVGLSNSKAQDQPKALQRRLKFLKEELQYRVDSDYTFNPIRMEFNINGK